MAQGILKEIGLFNESDMIEPDAIADVNFFMGDLNFRYNSTYQQFAPQIDQAPLFYNQLDQLHVARQQHAVFPGYEEAKIEFMPTYKRGKN